MQSAAINDYEHYLQLDWELARESLEENFSLGALMGMPGAQERSISESDWHQYFSSLKLSKSTIRFVKSANDNTIVDLSEAEIDYVVGGVAAVPVLGAVVVVAAAVALAVAVFVAAGGFVSIYAAAATHVWVSS